MPITTSTLNNLMRGKTRIQIVEERSADILSDDRLGTGMKLLFMALLIKGEHDRDKLVYDYGISPASVSRWTNALQDLGLIEIELRGFKPALYRVKPS